MAMARDLRNVSTVLSMKLPARNAGLEFMFTILSTGPKSGTTVSASLFDMILVCWGLLIVLPSWVTRGAHAPILPARDLACLQSRIPTVYMQLCGCAGLSHIHKGEQLLAARCFPATMTDPRSAFTFNTLKLHHIFHMQGKMSTYDFSASLERLTDNVFPSDVPVSCTRHRLDTKLETVTLMACAEYIQGFVEDQSNL